MYMFRDIFRNEGILVKKYKKIIILAENPLVISFNNIIITLLNRTVKLFWKKAGDFSHTIKKVMCFNCKR